MQREHVVFALTGLAVDYALLGKMSSAQALVNLSMDLGFVNRMADLLNNAMDDQLTNDLISQRIVEEQRKKKR